MSRAPESTSAIGSMRALVGALDWSRTPLGPMAQWPQSLKTMVRFMLDSRYSMWMGWGPELTFFYNDAYARDTLGAKHPWALGRPAGEVWAEIWSDIGPRIERVLRKGEATWDEGLMLFLERSGYTEETYHTFSYSPVYGDDGAIAGMFCVVTEETQRVVAERRVNILRNVAAALTSAKTEREVHAAAARGFDACSLPFSLTFIGGELVSRTGFVDGSFDPAMLRPNAWPLDAVGVEGGTVVVDDLGQRFTSVPCGAWKRSPSRALLVPMAQQGQEMSGVFVAGVNPHRELDVNYRGFIDLLVGQIGAALGTARSFQEQRERAESLAALDHAKTTFFSNVSHELRTPLTLMLGPLEDALGGDLALSAQEGLAIAHRNGLRLLKLVNSLLDFSRIEAGRVQASFQPTDLAKLTSDLASVFRSAVERAGMRLSVEADPIGEPVYVDRDMWEKVVLNLLSNAFKYTLEGSIEVSLRRVGNNVELAVRDTGIGVPADEVPNLFRRFHRVEGAGGRTQEGTGIGLALVHELVRLHCGHIGVDSEYGKGSTFTVAVPLGFEHLPADRIKAAPDLPSTAVGASAYLEEALRWLPEDVASSEVSEGSSAVPESVGQLARTRGARVLVADDNADMRAYLSRLLAPFWTIEAVGDGEAALAAARTRRPDLVLSDVMMPRLDGFGLLEALRADPALRGIPLILLSARAGEESRVEGMHAGADDYLVKPFSSRELVARVGAHLELARVRRDADAAIAEARRRSDAALLAADVGTYYWPLGSPRMFGDRNFARIMGVEVDAEGSVALDDVRARLHVDDRAKAAEVEKRSLTDDAPLELEYRLVLDDSRERWVIARARTERDRDGVPIGRGGVVVDVTARKHAEQRALEAERAARIDAERVGRMKDEFLATLSHELRTPLNAMLGWTQLLRSRRGNEGIDEGLDVIERNARTQAQLIEELLDMSRIVSGKIRLDVQTVDPSSVVAAALDVVRPAAEAKGVRLVQTLDPQAGPVCGDPGRLQQVLWNLLSNAVKFTPRGGRVHVVLERVNSHAELSVADTGKGIAPDFLPHVFERFRQEDGTPGRSYGGLGLGLAIVKQLVELHGGQVSATSAGAGEGAIFVVSLPLAPWKPTPDVTDPRQRVAVATTKASDHGPRLDRLKVLVVDDDRDARDILRYLLEECGASVVTAENADEALIALRIERPDLLLSDIGLPGVDGYELMRRVRQLGPEEGGRVPAVAVSAFARSEDRRRALMAGYQMHMAKPVEPSELRAVCASLAERR